MKSTTENIGIRLVLVLCCTGFACAWSSYVSQIPNGNLVPQGSGVGHVNPGGGGPRNQFGLDFAAASYTWSAPLCQKDSDGDGFTNGQELGDPSCSWRAGRPNPGGAVTHPGLASSRPQVTVPTPAPPTPAPPTPAPPTPAPPTPAPPTPAPPTPAPPTPAPPTPPPPTPAPPTALLPTAGATIAPTTAAVTAVPTTAAVTAVPTTAAVTAVPTTAAVTTAPTTVAATIAPTASPSAITPVTPGSTVPLPFALQVSFTFAGSVESFSRESFRSALARDLNVSLSDVTILSVTPGSVNVVVSIRTADVSRTQASIVTLANSTSSAVLAQVGKVIVRDFKAVAVTLAPTATPLSTASTPAVSVPVGQPYQAKNGGLKVNPNSLYVFFILFIVTFFV